MNLFGWWPQNWWPRKRAGPIQEAQPEEPRDPLPQAIQKGEQRLRHKQTTGLPLNRQELADKLSELGTAFDNARTQRDEAKLVKRGVEVAVELKERAAQMGKEGKDLKGQAAEMYQQHFSEEDGEESAPAAPAPAADDAPASTP